MYALDRLLYLKKKRATASTACTESRLGLYKSSFVPTGVKWNALKTDVRRYLPLFFPHVINIMMLEMFYLMKFF